MTFWRRYNGGAKCWFDLALAIVWLAACESELALTWSQHSRPLLDALFVACLTLPVRWRRTAPLQVCVVVMVVTVATVADTTGIFTLQASLLVVFLPTYAAGAYAAPRPALAGLVVCMAGMEAAVAVARTGAYWAVFVLGMGIASWAVGRTVNTRRSVELSLARTQVVMRQQGERLERMAIANERERIASDLQAVVVECLTAMIEQSRIARQTLDNDGSNPHVSIELIEHTGQTALGEMRRMLHLLQDESAYAVHSLPLDLPRPRSIIPAATPSN